MTKREGRYLLEREVLDKPIGRGVTRSLTRAALYRKSNGQCWYCGVKLMPKGYGTTEDGEMVIDHIVPFSKGGGRVWNNLVACCARFNNVKGTRSIEYLRTRLWLNSIGASTLSVMQAEWFYDWLIEHGFDVDSLPSDFVFYF